MKYTILLFLFLSSCSISLIAQRSPNSLEEFKTTKNQISKLKNGVLLVRLFTKSKGIESLRKKGFTNQANQKEQEITTHNLNLIKAFKEEFSFCRVTFFLSDDSEAVKTGNFEKVTFLNDSLELDSSINPSEFGEVFIGEHSHIESVNKESGQIDRGFSAFIIRDANFNQLKRPFPYYQRSYHDVIFLKKSEASIVKKLQIKLEEFYR